MFLHYDEGLSVIGLTDIGIEIITKMKEIILFLFNFIIINGIYQISYFQYLNHLDKLFY